MDACVAQGNNVLHTVVEWMLNLQYLLILKKRKTGVHTSCYRTREIHLQKWRDGQRVFVLKYLNDFARNGKFNRATITQHTKTAGHTSLQPTTLLLHCIVVPLDTINRYHV